MRMCGWICYLGLIHLLSQLALFILILPNSAVAQITPDSTVGTTVTPNMMIKGVLSDASRQAPTPVGDAQGTDLRIDGGAIRGSNLFHSFSEFNIKTGGGVYFTNPADITNIFTRVTGTNPSNINGTLGVLGNANLFFMNPNGIVFGTEAKLDVKGSFLGTSAMSINFADGTLFSASNPHSSALLTVSVPVGLGFGSNSGAITVQGTGHKLTGVNSFAPYILGVGSTGLQVQPGKTLSLVGGELNLTGGILTAEQGRIELGSVGGMGLVSLHPTDGGFTLSYAGVSDFGDIKLAQQAFSNVTGASAGSIQVQGRRVSFSDGSVLWAQNRGTQPGGIISIHGTELLEFKGYTLDGKMPSSIYSETVGVGAASDIAIATEQVSLRDGSTISRGSFGV